jgi:hypothetical protein
MAGIWSSKKFAVIGVARRLNTRNAYQPMNMHRKEANKLATRQSAQGEP